MRFQAGMGAEAVKKLLQDIELEKEVDALKEELRIQLKDNVVIVRLNVLKLSKHSVTQATSRIGWFLKYFRSSRRNFVRWYSLMVDVSRHLT